MKVPLWVAELAAAFWEAAGAVEPFPRHLRRPIARGWPLTVISLPQLGLDKVRDWLQANQVACPCLTDDRALRACLAAHVGWGFVFLDGTDPEQEQRFSLAHELAHFLRHYWQPRRHAARRLGPQVLEVFDGLRPPTTPERLHAALAGVPLGFHWHLMERNAPEDAIALAEQDADRLAYELLAPADLVCGHATLAEAFANPDQLATLLQNFFGLPRAQAAAYSQILVPAPVMDTLLRRLGKKS
jgi:hypothetical protein